jgi:predicted hotdog family 3-hydroxylacyl-ACP dehydratase
MSAARPPEGARAPAEGEGTPMNATQQLDQAGIARLIPHSGSMCLLERLESWNAHAIHCTTGTHRRADNPLRTAGGLLAPNAIEYAAQAMALHGGLIAPEGSEPSAGFLASARNVRMAVPRLDDIEGVLHVHAQRVSGDASQILYEFAVKDEAGRALAEGRAVVVLNTPLAKEA